MIHNIVIERYLGDRNLWLAYNKLGDYSCLGKDGSFIRNKQVLFKTRRHLIQVLKANNKVLGLSKEKSCHEGLDSTVFMVKID